MCQGCHDLDEFDRAVSRALEGELLAEMKLEAEFHE